MKKQLLMIAAGVALCVGSSQAQDPSRHAKAEELLTLMNMQENIEKSFAMVKKMIPAQMEKMKQATGQTNTPSNVSAQTDKVMELISQELSWEKMKESYIALYADTFTDDELQAIISFYKSPAGQTLIKKQPELMKRSMELSQKTMLQVMPKVQAMAREMSEPTPAPVPAKAPVAAPAAP